MKVLRTPRFGLAKPANSRAAMANGKERENPNINADIIAPIDPMINVGLRPIRSLMRAH